MARQLLTMVILMVCLADMYISGVHGQQWDDKDIGAMIREELDKKLADVMREARQDTEELKLILDRQSATIRRLEDENTALKQDTAATKLDNESFRRDIIALQRENIALKQDIGALTQDAITMKQKLDVVEKLGDGSVAGKKHIEEMLADLRHDDEGLQIAFSVASYADFGPVEDDENIPFETVYTNVGDLWNPATDVFQALVPGVYMFSASIRSDSTVPTHCNMVHTSASTGQTRVASMFGHDSDLGVGGDANIVIIEMSLGDVFSVQLQPSGSISSSSDDIFSTFSGFLLFQ